MDISEFVKEAIGGRITINGGIVVDGKIVEGMIILPKKAEDITAEAFNRGIFSENTEWENALAQVVDLLEDD